MARSNDHDPPKGEPPDPLDQQERIEMVRGAVAELPDRQEAVEGHLAECADCAGHRDDLARTWHVMGEWDVPVDAGDLAREVVRRAAAQADRRDRSWRWPAMRAAAAVLLAVGVGHAAGRWARSRTAVTPAPDPLPTVQVDEQTVTDALCLAALDGGSRPGIAEAVLELPISGEEDER